MVSKWTVPAPKYGPTAEYGDCEADECRAVARTACATCAKHVCLGHTDHGAHSTGESQQSRTPTE